MVLSVKTSAHTLKTLALVKDSHLYFDSRTARMLKPLDYDEKEMIMEFRRKRLERKFLKVSAKEIARIIPILIRESCQGCANGHLSQMEHTCLLPMGKFAKLDYFDVALHRTSEAEVMKKFMENLKAIDLHVLEQNPIINWKTNFCVKHEQTIKQKVLESL